MNSNQLYIDKIVAIMCDLLQVQQEIIELHCSEPINGEALHLDAINQAYLVLELSRYFKIKFTDAELQDCAYWNLIEYAEHASAHINLK